MILIDSVVPRAIIPDETYRSHITCMLCNNVLVTPRLLKACGHVMCVSCIPSMPQKAGDPEILINIFTGNFWCFRVEIQTKTN